MRLSPCAPIARAKPPFRTRFRPNTVVTSTRLAPVASPPNALRDIWTLSSRLSRRPMASEEVVGIDIDGEANATRRLCVGQPAPQDRRHIHRAFGVQQQPHPVPAPDQRQRCGSGAEHADVIAERRSPPARPKSASTTPTTVSIGK